MDFESTFITLQSTYHVVQPLNATHSHHCELSSCRNILELIQFFEDSSCFYLVFEKLRGGKTNLPNANNTITSASLQLHPDFFMEMSSYFPPQAPFSPTSRTESTLTSWRPVRLSRTLPKRLTSCTQRVGRRPHWCRSPKRQQDYFFVLMVTMCFSAGIAHRDLKLENILCEYTDRVSDFYWSLRLQKDFKRYRVTQHNSCPSPPPIPGLPS